MHKQIVNGQKLAGADLRDKQDLQMKLNSAGDVVVCGANEAGCGILKNAPNIGEACVLVQAGETEVIVAGAIAINTAFGSDANGKAVALTYGTPSGFVHGRTTEAVTGTPAGTRTVKVFVNFLAPHRNA